MHIERAGTSGPTVMLVHGSGPPGWGAFEAVRPLAERFRLVAPHRSGYPPNPPLDRIDFEVQADELAEIIDPGCHLVGHSYGGVVAMLAAGRVGKRLASLTVIEPPCFGVARGVRAVEELISDLDRILSAGGEPRAQLLAFLQAVGSSTRVPDPLPPGGEAIVRANNIQRPPQEAVIPVERIRAAGVPVLVVTGGHHPAFDAVADVLVLAFEAERAVLTGAGHSVQRLGAQFNERLAAFVEAAVQRPSAGS